MLKKVLVSFTREQYAMIQKLEGKMGSSMAETVRNLVLAYLSEKTYMKDAVLSHR